jgi:hypothetical protein
MRVIGRIYLLLTACVARIKLATRCCAVVVMTCLAMLGGRAEACMVCIPFPEDTATDQLLQADVVVLGRENPDQPFSYVAIEVLKGKLEQHDTPTPGVQSRGIRGVDVRRRD